MKPFILLIGAGTWGKNLARNLHALGALHTVADTSYDLLQTHQTLYPTIQITDDFEQALTHPEITAVVVAAPAIQHYPIAKKCLLAGKDLFVEKPIALCSEEAEELDMLAKERNQILMVGHLLHYHPVFCKLKELVKEGIFGTLHHITSHRVNFGAYRTEEDAFWNFAPHDISMILSLVDNQHPDEINYQGSAYITPEVNDIALMQMKFQNNINAHIFVSWMHPYKEQRLTVMGSKAFAVFDDTLPWEEKLVLYYDPILMGEKPVANPNKKECILVEKKEPLKEECLHFIQCCLNREDPITNGQEALRVTRVLEAAAPVPLVCI